MSSGQRPVWLGHDKRKWDHARIHVQLLKDPRIGAFELAVYVGIAAHAECATGKAFPASKTLARYANISERKTRLCIDSLEAFGYIEVDRQPGLPHTYSLLPPPSMTPAPGAAVETGTSAPDDPPPRHLTTPHKEEREPSNEKPPVVPQEGDESDADFAAFWSVFPRKVAIGQARKAWRTATKKAAAETITAGAIHYAGAVRGEEPKYVAHPSTWLNGERWKDQALTATMSRQVRTTWSDDIEPALTDEQRAAQRRMVEMTKGLLRAPEEANSGPS